MPIDELGLSRELTLSKTQWSSIKQLRFQPRNSEQLRRVVEIVPGRQPGTYQLRASSIVGLVNVAGLQISIRPKCGARNLAHMLSVGNSRLQIHPDLVGAETGVLEDYIAPAFVDIVGRLTQDGLVEDYVSKTETGYRPRGRIEFGRDASGLPLPLLYTYAQFTADVPENQILKAALDRIIATLGTRTVAGSHAFRLQDRFEVSRLTVTPATLEPRPRFGQYGQAIALAKLILRGGGIEPAAGLFASNGILFDMPEVYEDYVSNLIRHFGTELGVTVYTQGANQLRYLAKSPAGANLLKLKPDFSFWRSGASLGVGDVKYKVRTDSAYRADLYQIFSYAEALKVPRALLVYVGKAKSMQLKIDHGEYRPVIEIISLDLDSASPADAEAKLSAAVYKVLEGVISPL